ncbi:MAG: histidine phosphatase family protein [Dehalococcoidia bacterium]|nr:MAG: histidine phosphatase family protein [bacterium]MCE7928810.1 histidine phosphatase family protein [Chloroflexi bacterium CFX7]MCK6565459.1 histidine phosphatase family protein [Dehalococcoidia bacterium]MCL4231694.1 phosphoglycerate mutase family protein [Dehalococcoidia bacterium]NUQ55128.1 histidine phosphatase family protein [Dehalococcoidia bacterium]
MITRVIVVRHGQTYGNIEGLFCGHSETELTPLGVRQARALGARLREMEIDAAYSSDLSRAAKTAEHALEQKPGLEAAPDPGLREMHYGEWEGRPGRELGERHPELLRDFFLGRLHGAPGGETLQQLRTRTSEAVQRSVEAHRGGTVLLVSHGNAIMAMLAEFLSLPIEATWSFACDNTSITRMQFSKSGRFTLLGYNDATHLQGLENGG